MFNDYEVYGLAIADQKPGSTGRTSYAIRSKTKRSFDVLMSAILGVGFLPVAASVALVRRLSAKGPVLERYQVIGQNGCEFEVRQFSIENTSRLGRWIERSGLHKLPQLWNVFIGDMSLVGPNPRQIDDFGPRHRNGALYVQARPGVVGPSTGFDVVERGGVAEANLDRDYIVRSTFLTDLAILARAAAIPFRG